MWLLLACGGGDDSRITYGDGDATPAFPVTSRAGVYLAGEDGEQAGHQVALVDVTGDGAADALVGPVRRTHDGEERPAVAVSAAPFAGNAELAWAAVIGVGDADVAQLRAVADLDEDGHADPVLHAVVGDDDLSTALVVANGPIDGSRWWPDDPGLARVQLPDADGWLALCPVAAGDANRDGTPDLLTCGRFYEGGPGTGTQGAVVLLAGPFAEGDQDVEPATLLAAPDDEVGFGAGVLLDDFAGAGLVQAVVLAPGNGSGGAALYHYEVLPEGVVEAPDADLVVTPGVTGGAFPGGVASGDLTGDGYPDLALLADLDEPSVVLLPGPLVVTTAVEGVTAWVHDLPVEDDPLVLVVAGDVDLDGHADLALGAADDPRGGPGGGSFHLLFAPFPAERVSTVYGEGEVRQRPDGVSVHQDALGAALAVGFVDEDDAVELLVGAPGWSNDSSGVVGGAWVLDGGGW